MVALNAIGALALLVGATLGLGLWLLMSAVPRFGRPRLVERVAPYVADIAPAARAMLDRNPRPTDAEIRAGMEGVLCRCMSYYRIQAAIKRAVRETAAASLMDDSEAGQKEGAQA